MALTSPRPLPNNARVQECWFELQDNVASSPSGQNKINLSQVNPPAWKANITTAVLRRDQEPIWNAWRISLRGGLGSFVAYDVRRRAPLAYPNARTPGEVSSGWNGLCGVSTVGLSGLLGLSGLPVGYQFKAGDRIGLEQGGKYGYYEVMEDVTATGSAATVTVRPFLHRSLFTTAATARIWRPVCQFIIDGTSWSQTGRVENSAISFTGVQRV